jgi:hypothetical protein
MKALKRTAQLVPPLYLVKFLMLPKCPSYTSFLRVFMSNCYWPSEFFWQNLAWFQCNLCDDTPYTLICHLCFVVKPTKPLTLFLNHNLSLLRNILSNSLQVWCPYSSFLYFCSVELSNHYPIFTPAWSIHCLQLHFWSLRGFNDTRDKIIHGALSAAYC